MTGKMSIKLKLMVSVVAIVVIMMTISVMVNMRISFNTIYQRIITKEAPASVSRIAETFEGKMHQAISISSLVADNPHLIHWMQNGEAKSELNQAIGFLKEVKKQDADFVFMVTKKENNYYTHDGFFKKMDPSNPRDNWFYGTLKSGTKLNINIDVAEKTGILMAYINILMGPVDNPYGVAGCGINLETLSKQLSEVKITPGSICYLIGSEGGIKAHPNSDYIKEGKNIRTIDDTEFKNSVVPNIMGKEQGYIEYKNKEKTEMLVVYKSIPSTGWKVVTEIPKKELGKGLERIRTASIAMLLFSVVLLIVVLNIIVSVILKSVRRTTEALNDIAAGEGDLTKRLTVHTDDEIGELAKSFNLFLDKLHSIITDVIGHSSRLNDSASHMLGISKTVSDEADATAEKMNNIAVSSDEVNTGVSSVAAAMEEAGTNVSMIAASIEEMSATVREISSRTTEASSISQNAVSMAGTTSTEIQTLGEAAQEIGRVTETITEISEQTNLLALNATIEAARAGDAGKGFAVVAGEIKELATQTARATFEINEKVNGIQNATTNSIDNIEKINSIINDVNDLVTSIAAAIEEQTVTSQEISNNVTQLSAGVSETSENLSGSSAAVTEISNETDAVNQSVTELAESGVRLSENAEKLSSLSDELKELMSAFKV